jgi:hypothetical protein
MQLLFTAEHEQALQLIRRSSPLPPASVRGPAGERFARPIVRSRENSTDRRLGHDGSPAQTPALKEQKQAAHGRIDANDPKRAF